MRKTFTALFLITMSSCAAFDPIVTEPTGTVRFVSGDEVKVSFPIINRRPGSELYNWFELKNHSYQVGDKYPN